VRRVCDDWGVANPWRPRADNYETACRVVVDAKEIPCFCFISPLGPCFAQPYEVVYIYGQTEFKAQLRWEEGVCCGSRRFR